MRVGIFYIFYRHIRRIHALVQYSNGFKNCDEILYFNPQERRKTEGTLNFYSR